MDNQRRTIALLLAALMAYFAFGASPAGATNNRPPPTAVFVDTDIGVDDAFAVAYLLRERSVNVVGFTTVNGNTTVDNATKNLLTLLDTMQLSKPVTIGAAEPLVLPASRVGKLVHGPSGLWFSQAPHDLSGLPTDAPAAIAAAARANPGLTLLTLGPLTNVARAIQQYPQDMAGVKIVALGGAQGPGNRTPVAETNIYIDPHAAEIVLGSGLNITLVTLDAFNQVTVDSERFTQKLTNRGGAVGQLLAAAFGPYAATLTSGEGGEVELPDVAAAVYIVRPNLGTAESALVRVIEDNNEARGQTIIVTDPSLKVGLAANDVQLSDLADRFFSDPNFNLLLEFGMILAANPDNAQVVLEVRGGMMANLFEHRLTSN
jgi:inosine-uridine nucleoside N-ribohydrolase